MEKQLIPAGYKQTEVGVIPDSWQAIKLGDFCEFTQGVQIPQSKQLRNSKNGYIRYLYIRDFFTDDFPWYVQDVHPKKIMIKTDIMMVNTGNTAGTVYSGAYGVLSNNAFKITYDERIIDRDYLFSLLRSYIVQDSIKELFNSSGQPHVGHKNVAQVIIPVPQTIQEQTAIANALSDVDALIAALEKLINKKSAIKTAAMQQLLTGKKRLPPFDQLNTGYKQTELGEIPGDWGVKTLDNLVVFSNGSAHENHIKEDGKYIVVNSKFISTEGTIKKYSDECFSPTKAGNILMVMSDVPNGKAIAKCFLVEKENGYTINQRICSLEPKGTDSKYLFFTLNRNPFYLQFDDGAKQTNLRRQDVLACPVLFPAIEEQTTIAKVLSDMDKDLEALQQRLHKTQQIKQGMMQELLTGRTRLI